MSPSERTLRLLVLMRGGTTKEIAAEALGMTERSVRRHIRDIERAGFMVHRDDDHTGGPGGQCARYYTVTL